MQVILCRRSARWALQTSSASTAATTTIIMTCTHCSHMWGLCRSAHRHAARHAALVPDTRQRHSPGAWTLAGGLRGALAGAVVGQGDAQARAAVGGHQLQRAVVAHLLRSAPRGSLLTRTLCVAGTLQVLSLTSAIGSRPGRVSPVKARLCAEAQGVQRMLSSRCQRPPGVFGQRRATG